MKSFQFGSKLNSSVAASESSSEVPISLGLLKNYVSSNAVTSSIKTRESKVLRIVQEKSMSGSSAGFSNWTTGSICSNDSFSSVGSVDHMLGRSKHGKSTFLKKYGRAMQINDGTRLLNLVHEEPENKIGRTIPLVQTHDNEGRFSNGNSAQRDVDTTSNGRRSLLSRGENVSADVKNFATFRLGNILSPDAKPKSIKMAQNLGDFEDQGLP